MNDPRHWLSAREFRPHPLLLSGHAQTFFAAYGNHGQYPYRARQHLIPASGDDQLVLHEDCPAAWKAGDPSALLIHGLCGCHGSPYMVRMAHKLEQRGVRAFRMDMRGCGAGFRLAQQPGHAGRSEDVAAVVEFLSQYAPQSPLVLIGVSLGANLLLKLLGEWGDAPPPSVVRALAVAPPIDLAACAANIERPAMFAYNRFFLRLLMQQVRERCAFTPALSELSLVPPPKTLMQFDDRVTARLSGFRGADEYYRRSSSLGLLGAIRVPTIILASMDDPVVPVEMFSRVRPSPHVKIHLTRRGGHAAYIARANGDPDRYWLDWRVIEFVTQLGAARRHEAANEQP